MKRIIALALALTACGGTEEDAWLESEDELSIPPVVALTPIPPCELSSSKQEHDLTAAGGVSLGVASDQARRIHVANWEYFRGWVGNRVILVDFDATVTWYEGARIASNGLVPAGWRSSALNITTGASFSVPADASGMITGITFHAPAGTTGRMTVSTTGCR